MSTGYLCLNLLRTYSVCVQDDTELSREESKQDGRKEHPVCGDLFHYGRDFDSAK